MATVQVQRALDDERSVRALLDFAFGGDFSDDDWDHCLGGWHVVVHDNGELVAHAAVVPRTLTINSTTHRAGYVEAVATHPAHQKQGLGSLAMAAVNQLVQQHFELGALSTSSHGFYERLGWKRWQGPSFVLEDAVRTRTADEDDGIMVLGFDDVRAEIACQAREGDAW